MARCPDPLPPQIFRKDTNPLTAGNSDTDRHSSWRGVLTSLGFWVCLMLSAMGYAVATLSVSCAENHQLAQRFAAGEVELRLLMDQVDRYEKYCDVLSRPIKQDRALGETARSMGLDRSLTFRIDEPTADQRPSVVAVLSPWIEIPSRSPVLRGLLLAASAILLVVAFTTLVDGDGPRLRRPKRMGSIRGPLFRRLKRIGSRYHAQARQ